MKQQYSLTKIWKWLVSIKSVLDAYCMSPDQIMMDNSTHVINPYQFWRLTKLCKKGSSTRMWSWEEDNNGCHHTFHILNSYYVCYRKWDCWEPQNRVQLQKNNCKWQAACAERADQNECIIPRGWFSGYSSHLMGHPQRPQKANRLQWMLQMSSWMKKIESLRGTWLNCSLFTTRKATY